MKRTFLTIIMVLTGFALISCGHDHTTSTSVAQILSDAAYDGDIAYDPTAINPYTITQGNSQSVFAGIDPVSGTEYRAFLDFPLNFSCNAGIVSATLDIYINSILPNPLTGTIPVRLDLVSFQPPTLINTDFDRTIQFALATATIYPPISQADYGQHVVVDVTSLMDEAQHQCLPDLQIRILEDLGLVSPGLIEINDTTGSLRASFAPLLQVEYF